MSPTLSHIVIAFTVAFVMVPSYARPAVQTSSKADVRPAIGDWRSSEQFENQSRATVVVHEDAGTLSGSLTLLGMTRGADDRATVRVPFRGAAWNGTTLTFETVLPDNEGTSRWALRVAATGKATLYPTADDGKPVEDGQSGRWSVSDRATTRSSSPSLS